MRTIYQKIILLPILLCSQFAVNAQTAVTEVYPNYKITINKERLDVDSHRNRYNGSMLDYSYRKSDGTTIRIKSFQNDAGFEVVETPPEPAIHYVYKRFYADGNLKEMGVFLPRQVKVGKWMECDDYGRCTIINHEIERDAYGYNDVLEYLRMRGHYMPLDDNKWKCSFWHSPDGHTWGTRVDRNDEQYKMYTFDDKGKEDVRENDLFPNKTTYQLDLMYKPGEQ
ncbi:hypothetical protein M2451_002036 [Dysgonomonas sp. PFB1-18]|uniref:hypothetical protein n=1 Tax=unclassified Dysgonomonas TaxID=2630389 RepID=UPI002475C712|nr:MULTISPECIES: hypothetical protein [unclassified Dysgonomonas]MDH6309780.1 hypothetical protein [Dysgonomonas sp. PF1-14]MDH6339212.1 hypothetical protein [Dysgonomonas sp. PF1-16]MDH6380711.1 hypothetical protein [Dysgonomonas sp. PFB1-18]MDH6398207.1 hypothetical protein [Dysgonomonas sp. PF1-23]